MLLYWHNIYEIIKLATIVVICREGYDVPDDDHLIFFDENSERIKLIEADVIDVSSSKIKNELKLGKSLKKYLSPGVNKYIIENNLYQ